MKTVLLSVSAVAFFTTLKENLFPDMQMLLMLGIAIATDFMSGIGKSMALHTPILSNKMQRTATKTVKYGLMVIVSFIFRSMVDSKGELTELIGRYLNSGCITFLIYIEVVSILENIIAMDKGGWLSKIVKPIHYLITLQIKTAINQMAGNIAVKTKKDDK